jgi:tetratricopeptide (TPR) repeat protein
VGVADCHLSLGESASESYGVQIPSAKGSLEQAINLDPDLPEAHASLSALFFDHDDMPGAEAEARRALELNPSLPDAHRTLWELAALREDREEMVKQMETAYRLDPARPHFIWLLGHAYLCTGREQEALEHWKKTEHLAPAFTYRGMMEYYLAKGDLEKASEFYTKAEKLDPTRPWIMWMHGYIAALEGNRDVALQAIRKIEDAKMGPIAFNFIAYVYHALGDLDAYFANMNKALPTHALVPLFLMHSPLLAKARTDPRYPELLEKLRKQLGLTK